MASHGFTFNDVDFWDNLREDLTEFVQKWQPDIANVYLHDVPMICEGLLAQIKSKTNQDIRKPHDLALKASSSETGTGLFNIGQTIRKGDSVYTSKPFTTVVTDPSKEVSHCHLAEILAKNMCHWCFALPVHTGTALNHPSLDVKLAKHIEECPRCKISYFCDEVS
jgi:hypothetical protein